MGLGANYGESARRLVVAVAICARVPAEHAGKSSGMYSGDLKIRAELYAVRFVLLV